MPVPIMVAPAVPTPMVLMKSLLWIPRNLKTSVKSVLVIFYLLSGRRPLRNLVGDRGLTRRRLSVLLWRILSVGKKGKVACSLAKFTAHRDSCRDMLSLEFLISAHLEASEPV